MKRIYTLLLALLPLALTAQQNKPKDDAGGYSGTVTYDYPNNFTGTIPLNYVRTIEPMQATSYAGLNGLRGMGGRTLEQTLYMDGYLRPLQSVTKKWVNNYSYSKDLVKFYNYDASGRIVDDMLPFGKTDRSVAAENKFDKNVFSDQVVTYTNLKYVGDNYRFDRTVYEPSLLGRVLEKRGAGDSWTGHNKGVIMQTRTGLGDAVRRWDIDYSGNIPAAQGTYSDADIIVHITTDEDGLTSKNFYDLEGRLIATENNEPEQRTYYVYDIYDRLRCVMPPKAIEAIKDNSWTPTNDIMNNLCFRYNYDVKGNQTRIKKPGIGYTDFRYDLYGRVVFSQDAMQRTNNKWVFYKYDEQGRLIQQGLFDSQGAGVSPPVNAEDYAVLNNLLITYIYNTPVYKSSDYVYSFNNTEFMIHYYFDDYDFIDTKLTTPSGPYDAGKFQFVASVGNATEGLNKNMVDFPSGLLTGIYTAVSDNSKWIAHVNYYNSDGQLIQTVSDDLEDRISVSATGYDFRGNATKTVFQNNDATIQKRYHYDCYDRLRRIDHKVGNATSYRTIAKYEFDEIGRMQYKKLGMMNYTEVYDYNIRGWITGINKKYAQQAIDGFHFGEELCYEKGFEEKYFNGRLAGITWRARGTQDDLRAYGYIYDNKQRLTKGDYFQYKSNDWDKNDKDFTTDIGYDVNGNILNMKHMGLDVGGNTIVLDDLAYQYETGTNKLLSVTESSASLSTDPSIHDGLGDFRDAQNGDDYQYDANGNVIADANRQITTMTSNWFTVNKPLNVMMGNNSVYYIYDAMGNLLRKRTVWLDLTFNDKKTDYVGELTYENNTVTLIAHDEGRIRLVPDPVTSLITYEYDYYLRDHLQNIRAVINEVVVEGQAEDQAYDPSTYNPTGAGSDPAPVSYDVDPVGYIATSEPGNAAWETDLFDRVNETRGTRPLPTSPDDNYAAILDAASSRVIGPGKLIKVMAGDRIELGAEAFFHSNQNPSNPVPINTLVSQVISALSGAAAVSGEISNVFSQAMINTEMLGMALNDMTSSAINDTTAPSAYLNYLVFNEAFEVIPEASGALQVSQADAWQNLAVPQFELQQNGYVYVFTSNQSQATVSTDNLHIYHWKSVLLEEFHYYPFGLTFEVSSQLNLPGSLVRYNSQSIERNEFTASGGNQKYGLDWYDFMARSYDAQLGRWMQPDPMMQHASPYLAMSNNPTIFTDPLGLSDGPIDPILDWFGRVWDRINGRTTYRVGKGASPIPSSSTNSANSYNGQYYTFNRNMEGYERSGPTDLGLSSYYLLSEDLLRRGKQLDIEDASRKSVEYDLMSSARLIEQGNAPKFNYDIDKAVDYLNATAKATSSGKCARYVRMALEAGGINTNPHPISAKDYGPYLTGWGFKPINEDNYTPLKGDINVIQSYQGGSVHGHIQMYTGKQWLSDFKQKGFWPGAGYRTNKPSYQIFRWPSSLIKKL